MSGQKPKVNTIFFPLPIITNDNIDDYYDPSMTMQSTCFANGKDRHLVTDAYSTSFSPAARRRRRLRRRTRCFLIGAAETTRIGQQMIANQK
jgi:ribose transport system substrate-binding protein